MSRWAIQAAQYYEACNELLQQINFETVASVDFALSALPSDQVDNSTVSELVDRVAPVLSRDSTDTQLQLACCMLLLRFRVKCKSTTFVDFAELIDKLATTFREHATALQRSASKPAQCAQLVEIINLWKQVVKLQEIEPEFLYLLLLTALQWIFSLPPSPSLGLNDEWQLVSHQYIELTCLGFAQLSQQHARNQLLHDILSLWFKQGEQYSKYVVELVLGLVAVTGQVPHSIASEAKLLRQRSIFENEARLRHQQALGTATLISRRIIDWSWSTSRGNSSRKSEVQQFLEDVGTRLSSPKWPAAELFLSAFISTLFKFVRVIKSQKYPMFLFSSLRTVQDYINISSSPSKNEENASSVVLLAIRACTNHDQASYLAARQCVLENQPWMAFIDAADSVSPSSSSSSSSTSTENTAELAQEWPVFLRQWPIATYHQQITNVLTELALREDLKSVHQIELFRVLETTDIFDLRWLDRLSYAPPTLCEVLVPLVSKHYAAKSGDDTSLAAVNKLCTRIASPGAPGFKKRVLHFLLTAQDKTKQLVTQTWRAALLCATDTDSSVRSDGLKACEELFDREDNTISSLAASFSETSDKVLLQHGLRQFVQYYTTTKNNGRVKIQHLVKQLIHEGDLNLSAQFLEVDGTFMPASELSQLFTSATTRDPESTVLRGKSLRMVDLALCSRPRIILAQAQVAKMFSVLVSRLSVCPEPEMKYVGSILGQLIQLDTPRSQAERKSLLLQIVEKKSLPAAQKFSSEDALFKPAVLIQSLLVSGCVRFWSNDTEKLRGVCHALIQIEANSPVQHNQSVRLVIVRNVFAIASKSSILFGDTSVNSFLNKFDPLSPEAECITRLLLQHMWESGSSLSSEPTDTSSQTTPESKLKSQEMIKSRFFGLKQDKKAEAEAAASIMLQQHLARLMDIARSEENVNALRVVVKALEDNLVVADECIPTITFLCFSSKPGVSPTALRAFRQFCDRSPPNLGVKAVEGLKLVPESQSSLRPFPAMWTWLRKSLPQTQVKPLFVQFVNKLLRFTAPLSNVKLIIDGLSSVELSARDAKLLVTQIEDELNQYEPLSHKPNESLVMVLVHVFAYWLRRRYGFSEYNKYSKFGTKGEDTDLEPMDSDAIEEYLSGCEDDSSTTIAEVLRELWKIPDYYGTDAMNSLVLGFHKNKRAKYI